MPPSPSRDAWRKALRFWRSDVSADIDAELRFHFDSRVEALQTEGIGPAEARRIAAEEFGDEAPVRQDLQRIDTRLRGRHDRQEWVGDFLHDLRYALRSLGRAPAFSVAVVLTLALGFGAVGTIGSLLDALYFRPPAGVAAPGELRRLWMVLDDPATNRHSAYTALTYPDIQAAIDATAPVPSAVYTTSSAIRFASDGAPVEVTAGYASGSFFGLLGAVPQRGRFFGPDEDHFGTGAAVLVLSDAFWRTHFAADPAVLGRTVRLAQESYTIVGIAAPGFSGVDLEQTDLWIPFSRYPGVTIAGLPWWASRNWSGFHLLTRLPATLDDAGLAARTTAALQAAARQEGSADSLVTMVPGPILAARGPAIASAEQTIAIRMAGVAIAVLLITCANVVNLFLARMTRREHEMGIRLALGVRRGRLLRLLLTESLLLATAAGVAAALLVLWSGTLLRALLFPDLRWAAPPLTWRVVVMIALVTAVAGTLIGLLPAVRALAVSFTGMLRRGGRNGTAAGSGIRRVLIVGQTAFSVLLLVGAALFVRSLLKVRSLEVGYDVEHLATATVRSATPFRDPLLVPRMEELAREFSGWPGVEGVALSSQTVMRQGGFGIPWYTATDSTGSRGSFRPTVALVTPAYFRVTGLRLVQGDIFSGTSQHGVVVNEVMAQTLWPAGQAVGQCLRLQRRDAACHTVLGVVSQARRSSVTEAPLPQYFMAAGDSALSLDADILVARIQPDRMDGVMARMNQRLRAVFPDDRITVRSLSDQLAPQYRPWRLGSMLFVLCGLVALLVASVGIYSNIACDIGQRTRELGIRVALGARPRTIRRDLVRSAMRPVLLGVIIGLLLSLVAGRVVASLLYEVPTRDPLSLAVVAAVLLAAALLATLRPAWRAGAIHPMTAMRGE